MKLSFLLAFASSLAVLPMSAQGFHAIDKDFVNLKGYPAVHRDINKAPTRMQRISADDLRAREGQDFPIDTIQYVGPSGINFVLMGDGFKSTQYAVFTKYANSCIEHMFSQVPFADYRDWFNIYYIKVDSRESGISHPGYPSGTCPEGSSLKISNYDTYFGVYFDAYGIHRLMCFDGNKPYELLDALIPDYDIAGILGNSKEYGGSGGDILIASVNSESNEIFVHELGHTFAKLNDEYYAGDVYLYESSNTSKYYTEETSPWRAWWGQEGVKAFKIGGSTLGNKFYKPVNGTCKMEYLGKNFCAVCREALVKKIHNKVNQICVVDPAESLVKPYADATTAVFRLEDICEVPGYTDITWILDDQTLGASERELTLDISDFKEGEKHKLTVLVSDLTPYLKQTPISSFEWTIEKSGVVGIEITRGQQPTIIGEEGGITITSPDYEQFIIYGADGRRITSRHIVGSETISLPRGTYIVRNRKVMVN